MSKVKIQGNASGTGVVTLTAPNTNTDRTITLPDSSDTLVSTAPSTSGNILTSDGTNWTSAAPAAAGADTSLSNLSATGENRVAQAWVNFNGTGDYNVNFATTMNSANYAVSDSSTIFHSYVRNPTTTNFRYATQQTSHASADYDLNMCTVFGD